MDKKIKKIETELLVLAAQDGNKNALDELISRWQKPLWLHAYRLCRDQQACWDISQESWLAVIKGINKLHDPAHFKAWLFKIATNKAIDWINKKNRIQEKNNLETIEVPQQSSTSDNLLDELLVKLDMKKRTVILLYYYEELNINEISNILKIPPGTVKSRLANARNKIKQLIEKENNHE